MEVKRKKIVIWCGSGPNQKALANKIAQRYEIAGMIIESKTDGGKKAKLSELPGLLLDRLHFRKIYGAWKYLMAFYTTRFPDWPSVPVLKTGSINTTESLDFTEKLLPDLIIVSGTTLIKEPLLNTNVKIGIINLHTGLSPFVKGGPNCTNWCIANNTWEYVGNTIMWLNAGIDSGNIITSEAIDIRNEISLKEAHIKVMEHAHDLYLRTIEYLLNNEPPFQSVSQSEIAKGELYLNRMWTAGKRNQLLKNWKNKKPTALSQHPVTIPLPSNS
jgi:folate-dependent phosphoribosylglycinamide formyltransferase PurN